ncbi:unnamed protein product [Lampetra planeri]
MGRPTSFLVQQLPHGDDDSVKEIRPPVEDAAGLAHPSAFPGRERCWQWCSNCIISSGECGNRAGGSTIGAARARVCSNDDDDDDDDDGDDDDDDNDDDDEHNDDDDDYDDGDDDDDDDDDDGDDDDDDDASEQPRSTRSARRASGMAHVTRRVWHLSTEISGHRHVAGKRRDRHWRETIRVGGVCK